MTNAVRFEHTIDDARRLTRGFAGFYWVIVAALAVGAIWQRKLLLMAVAFALAVAVWQWRLGRVPLYPWVLTVDAGEVRLTQGQVSRGVARTEAAEVELVRRWSRGTSWWELQVRDHSGHRLLREGIRDDHRQDIETALRERGWPIRNRAGGR